MTTKMKSLTEEDKFEKNKKIDQNSQIGRKVSK